jgi:UDP:flavonoid glycosyltransferase YjiC (YdhE family)
MSQRLLYVSSSIGLGHVARDLAIARHLRRQLRDLELVWLAGAPASDVLREAGETVLPQARRWIGASAIAERCLRDGRLNLVRYVYRSLPAWALNARLVKQAVAETRVDAVVGDEAFEVSIPLIARVLRLDVPFVMIFDFMGVEPMTSSPLERLGAWVLNALWALDGRAYDGRPHSAVFIGELDDIADRPLGAGLPNGRRHVARHYDVVGHAIGFGPGDFEDRAAWRRRLGYGAEPLVVCAIGGTAVGRELLQLCADSFPALAATLPGARMVLVCGPRVSPASITAPAGVTMLGHVPRLHEHFACCDVAVVQCGGTSTTELAALRRPFVYAPVDGHFEQEVIAGRLARYGAGRRASLSRVTPQGLAGAIAEEYATTPSWAAMPVDGAARAAEHVAAVLAKHDSRTPARATEVA